METKDIKYTWDTSALYKNNEEWKADTQKITEIANSIEKYHGKIYDSPENLLNVLKLQDEAGMLMERTYVYSSCKFHPDMSNGENKNLVETIQNVANSFSEKLAFLEPELMSETTQKFDEFSAALPELKVYKKYMDDLFVQKPHILDEKSEALLVRMGDLAGSFDKIYDDLTVNDTEYEEIDAPNGEKMVVNDANYGKAIIDSNRNFRKSFFETLMATYGKHINTISSNYYSAVKGNVYLAKSRNYKSAREKALSTNFVPEKVYDNLISTVRKGVAPLQEYVDFRKEQLHIDDFHFYDFFVPVVEDIDKKYTYEEAAELTIEATKILGEDYTELVKRSFDERWTDVYPGKNKRSGAYSTGAYGVHPYMLLNYNETLDNVFTLAHEMGHSMHTYFSSHAQPYRYADYSIFCAEVASTTNEMLLYHYLLDHAKTVEEKKLLLSKHLDDIRSTFYRQTMFADFEYQTHSLVEKGEALLPDTLCEIHRKLNEDYYGKDFVADKYISYEWARIPHFYTAFYVYQYATGISAAIAISRRILKEGKPAVDDYRKFLASGSSNNPIELLKIAGVDMSTEKPINDTIEEFKETLKELKSLF